mgnify:FL=1
MASIPCIFIFATTCIPRNIFPAVRTIPYKWLSLPATHKAVGRDGENLRPATQNLIDMKRIINPWRGMDGYRCFGCDPRSEQGLRMEFYEDGDRIVSRWKPRPEFQGWVDTLHGGIQATLADEISSWVVFRKFQTSGVTSRMEVRYLKPIHTSEDHITLQATVVRQRRNIVDIEVKILNSQNQLCTEALCIYFLFPKEKAHEEFHFCECGVEEDE